MPSTVGSFANSFPRRGVHDNQCRRGAGTDEQPVRFFVKGSIAVALAAHRPSGDHLTFVYVYNLNLAHGGNEDE